MSLFVRSFFGIFAAYSIYLGIGWYSAPKDWQELVRHLPPKARVENRVIRKGVAKHFLYSDAGARASFDIQARDSILIVHLSGQGIHLLEELEGVVGSYWDQGKERAYTIFMPRALLDYPKKIVTGYQAQVQEFDAVTSKLMGKGSFDEVECLLKGEPTIHLRRVHAQLQKDS